MPGSEETTAAVPHSYAVKDLPALTGLGQTRLWQAIASGDLQAKKFGGRTIVLRTALDDFLNKLEPAR